MELVRIWIVDGGQEIVLSQHLWRDPASWGLMLADLARHVAKAYEREGGNEEEVLARIKLAFEAEWRSPTD
ncbi:MAG: DUF5076 domain-containing protein [Deltaproteobacteria bacterium]|nr:DUF5076 domain-containing protein [Deltaproteobacteria bacterium]